MTAPLGQFGDLALYLSLFEGADSQLFAEEPVAVFCVPTACSAREKKIVLDAVILLFKKAFCTYKQFGAVP